MQVISHSKHARNLNRVERMASIIGGGVLAGVGVSRRSRSGAMLAAAGGELIRRGVTGRSYLYEILGVRTAPLGQGAETTSVPYELGIRVDDSITILKPREEVFRFWRNPENLSRFLKHVEQVRTTGPRTSHWRVKGPAGRTVEWDAEIHHEVENEVIGWRSLEGAMVDHAGSVRFREAPGARGTEVRVELQYNPPGGVLTALLAQLWGEEPSQQIHEDLRRLKQMLETGEAVTVEGQPRGGEQRDAPSAFAQRHHVDQVTYASEESFPASDAPAWR